MIQTVAMGVSAEQEADWPRLAAAAVLATEDGREPVPAVWFRTDEGARGLIPVSELTPVTFTDDEEPARFIGTVPSVGNLVQVAGWAVFVVGFSLVVRLEDRRSR